MAGEARVACTGAGRGALRAAATEGSTAATAGVATAKSIRPARREAAVAGAPEEPGEAVDGMVDSEDRGPDLWQRQKHTQSWLPQ